MSGIHCIPFNPHMIPQGGEKRGERKMDEVVEKEKKQTRGGEMEAVKPDPQWSDAQSYNKFGPVLSAHTSSSEKWPRI